APQSDLDPAAGELVEHGQVLGEPQRVPEGGDGGGLADADAVGARGDVGAHQHRVGGDLVPLVAEVVLGVPDGPVAGAVGGDGELARLVHQPVVLVQPPGGSQRVEDGKTHQSSSLLCRPPVTGSASTSRSLARTWSRMASSAPKPSFSRMCSTTPR